MDSAGGVDGAADGGVEAGAAMPSSVFFAAPIRRLGDEGSSAALLVDARGGTETGRGGTLMGVEVARGGPLER
jgi:hypothetical protein